MLHFCTITVNDIRTEVLIISGRYRVNSFPENISKNGYESMN